MVHTVTKKPPKGDALDQLEYEDRALLQILEDFERADDRWEHGVAGKLFVEHLAVREAARESLAETLCAEPMLEDLGERLETGIERRREELVKLDELARGVQPMNLNQGQDFDGELEPIARTLRGEITRDLEELIPLIRERFPEDRRQALLPSARHVRRHAPTHPNPRGRRRHERFRLLVWLHAVYDWLRGFPTGGPVPSSEVDLPPNDNKPI